MVDEPEGLVLDHDIVAVHVFPGIVCPTLHHLIGRPGQVQGGGKGRGVDGEVVVHDGLLHVLFHYLKHDGVRDGAERPDGSRAVVVLLARHVLYEVRTSQ